MKDHPSYKELPTKVAKNVVIDVQNAFKSFFNALKQYQKTPKRFKSRPQIPWYLHKEYGRHVVTTDADLQVLIEWNKYTDDRRELHLKVIFYRQGFDTCLQQGDESLL